MYTYTVNDENVVEIFTDGNSTAFLRQPHYPNGDTFDTKLEAEQWAELFIASIEDELAPFAPNGKDLPGIPKPTEEEILASLSPDEEVTLENFPQEVLDQISKIKAES